MCVGKLEDFINIHLFHSRSQSGNETVLSFAMHTQYDSSANVGRLRSPTEIELAHGTMYVVHRHLVNLCLKY